VNDSSVYISDTRKCVDVTVVVEVMLISVAHPITKFCCRCKLIQMCSLGTKHFVSF